MCGALRTNEPYEASYCCDLALIPEGVEDGITFQISRRFDAFGTLFDVHSIAALAETLFPKKCHALSQTWRAK